MAIDPPQEFLVQPVDASWLQCNIECQEACPVGTNCRGYLNLAAEGRFEEGYILSREPNPVAAMCSYVCSAPCERACRRGDIDRPLAIRAMKRFLVEWHEASGIPDVMPQITPRAERGRGRGAGLVGFAVARELATGRPGDGLRRAAYGGGTMLIGVPAFRLPREAIEMDLRLVERSASSFRYDTSIGPSTSRSRTSSGDYDAIAITRRRDERRHPRRPGSGPRGRPVRRRLHEEGEPRWLPLVVGNDVVVIGGGYTAMDCARTSLRHGAEHVTRSPIGGPVRSWLSTKRNSARPSEKASGWSSSSARSSCSAKTAISPVSDSSATASASLTPRAAARRSPCQGSEFIVPRRHRHPGRGSQAADP